MPKKLKSYYNLEINAYQKKYAERDLMGSWLHLERAHVIGQAYPLEHTYAHWKMLKFGFYIKSAKEIIGQIPRLFIGGVKSFVGKVPIGNTGGANIPPLRSLPIENDILEIFEKSGVTIN